MSLLLCSGEQLGLVHEKMLQESMLPLKEAQTLACSEK